MKIYKHRNFHKWAKDEGITDETLIHAIDEMNKGLCEANLGSGLYKKRVAAEGKGKQGSYRTLIAFKQEEKAFFVYGFSKNMRENISDREKETYKKLSKYYMNLTDEMLNFAVKNCELLEIIQNEGKKEKS